MKKKLISVWAIAVCMVTLAFGQSGQSDKQAFSFVYMTDVHIKPDPAVTAQIDRLIDKVNKLNPDFVLSGGDQVYDVMRGNKAKSDSLYALYVQKTSLLKMPVHNTVGNHELFGIYPESDVDSTHADYKYGMYKRYLGKTYYSFHHKGWHFIVLNVLDVKNKAYYGHVDEQQLQWLKHDLAKIDPATPVVLTVHIPLLTTFYQVYPKKNVDTDGSEPLVTNRNEVLDVFKGHALKLVLQGHLHWLEDLNIAGKTHFITGGAVSGRPTWRGNEHGPRGFLKFQVSGDELDWKYITY